MIYLLAIWIGLLLIWVGRRVGRVTPTPGDNYQSQGQIEEYCKAYTQFLGRIQDYKENLELAEHVVRDALGREVRAKEALAAVLRENQVDEEEIEVILSRIDSPEKEI
jgi:hypothetical protein